MRAGDCDVLHDCISPSTEYRYVVACMYSIFFFVYTFSEKEHLSYSLGAALHLNTYAEQILITCCDFTRQEESGIEDGWMDFFGLKRHKCIFHYLPY